MTTALITGATSGIGRSMAIQMAKRGFRLILVARDRQQLGKLARILPTKVKVFALDLSNADNCRLLHEKTKNINIDILINNAGFGIFGEFSKTDLATDENLIDLNVKALHILTKLYLKDFVARDRGYILNVASIAAFAVGPLMATYYASKAYVLSLTQAIHEELVQTESSVHISALCPGPVDTGFNKRAGVSFAVQPATSDYVAKYALKKMFQGKTIILPTMTAKMVYLGCRIAPYELIGKICFGVQSAKQK